MWLGFRSEGPVVDVVSLIAFQSSLVYVTVTFWRDTILYELQLLNYLVIVTCGGACLFG